MVRHERVLKCVIGNETQQGSEAGHEKQDSRDHTRPETPAPHPERHCCHPAPCHGKVLRRAARVDFPAGITERQVHRPQQFAGVKPQRPARNQHPLQESERQPHPLIMGAQIPLPPNRNQPHRQTERDERHDLRGPMPSQSLPFQPNHQHQRRRQCASGGFGKQRQQICRQRQQVPGPKSRNGLNPVGTRSTASLTSRGNWDAVERVLSNLWGSLHHLQPRQQSPQAEEPGLEVLQFRHPRHRLDLDRVQREDGRRQPGAGDRQPPQKDPNQHRVKPVEQDIHQVVSRRIKPPKCALDPQSRIDQGKILRLRMGRKPDLFEPIRRRQHRVVRNILIIVPNEPGPERRSVGKENQQDNRQPGQRLLHPPGSSPHT